MRKLIARFVVIATCLFFTSNCFCQKRQVTYEQAFKNAATNVLKPIPVITGWTDDDHYIESLRDSVDIKKINNYLVEVKTGKITPYTPTPVNQIPPTTEKEKNSTLSPDGKWIAFTRDNNLFAKEIAGNREIQFTNDGSSSVYNGYAAWLYYEEILGRVSHHRAFWWSADSRHIAFMRFDEKDVPVFPIYNSEGHEGFLENEHYPKAGDNNPKVKLGIASIDNPKPVWADFNEMDDQYFGEPVWTPDGKTLWAYWMPRNQHTMKLYAIDPGSGSKREIYNEQQNTWIDLDIENRITFLPESQSYIFRSDKNGWMHLYLHKMNGSLTNEITPGPYSVTELVKVDEKKKLVYFKARKENSARFDLYKVKLDGSGLLRLTFGNYSHDVINISPGAKYFITTYSDINTPPKMTLVDGNGKIIRELSDSKGPGFQDYDIAFTRLFRVKSFDNLFDLPVTITYPQHFDSTKKYPVLISVYGGPNAGTVYDHWNNHGFLTNQWWAQEGLIQVAMDNRSSGHFGKTGMNYIYHQLGKFEIEDYMACGKWLRKLGYVDTSKICIMGGSFGGYITCLALTYGAAVFTHGIATSSVTDWSLYDTHYTERYMGTPAENPEGYKLTSPQSYVKQYRGLIRIIHGNMDDNVHMQNSIQLINKLEDLNKHFEFMIYPGERHGWGGLKAVHSRDEMAQFVYTHLLEKPVPLNFWQ